MNCTAATDAAYTPLFSRVFSSHLFFPCDGVLSNVFAGFVFSKAVMLLAGRKSNTSLLWQTTEHRKSPSVLNHRADCHESSDKTEDYDYSVQSSGMEDRFTIWLSGKEFQTGFLSGLGFEL